MNVRIIVDSSTDVAEAYLNRVQVVPLTLRFGEEEYYDGVTIHKEEFYRRLVESDELPTTSQATPLFPLLFPKNIFFLPRDNGGGEGSPPL